VVGDRRRRPWTVIAAVLLLGLTVLTLVAGAAYTVDTIIWAHRLLPLAGTNVGARAGEVADEQQLNMVIGIVAVAATLLPALVLAGLAWAVWRGHDIARRLLVPAVAVLTVLCGILAGSAPEDQVQEPLQAEVDRLVVAEQPWAVPEVAPRAIVIMLPPLAVALLLLPPSNRFFRQHRAARAKPGPTSTRQA
jgi:hypothetical protein